VLCAVLTLLILTWWHAICHLPPMSPTLCLFQPKKNVKISKHVGGSAMMNYRNVWRLQTNNMSMNLMNAKRNPSVVGMGLH
jgi:hypothetical protein